MKKFINICFVAAMAVCLSSCGSNEGQGYYIGKSKGYSDFLWKKFDWNKVELPTQSLQLDMGELHFTQPIKLQVVYLDENGNYLPVNSSKGRHITVLQNGKALEGSDIVIRPVDKNLDLQFRFNKVANPGTYRLFLKILDCGDLDQINGEEAKAGHVIGTGLEWQVKYEYGLNPLLIGLIWLCIIIVAILVLWFALLRWIIFPTFAFDNLQVTYFDGEVRKGREDCTLHGARKIICSASPNSQSGLNKLICGRIEYLTNPFWATTVEMTPCGSDGIAVNEDLKAGEAATYRMTAMITAQNGPRRPFVVKRTKSEWVANISIG